jgi:hypothetical protein
VLCHYTHVVSVHTCCFIIGMLHQYRQVMSCHAVFITTCMLHHCMRVVSSHYIHVASPMYVVQVCMLCHHTAYMWHHLYVYCSTCIHDTRRIRMMYHHMHICYSHYATYTLHAHIRTCCTCSCALHLMCMQVCITSHRAYRCAYRYIHVCIILHCAYRSIFKPHRVLV